jgi:Winged helix-turn-helix DNA-binding
MRLKAAGMPSREIARRVGAAPSRVRATIRRFEAAGLSWPLGDDVTDAELEACLFASAGAIMQDFMPTQLWLRLRMQSCDQYGRTLLVSAVISKSRRRAQRRF